MLFLAAAVLTAPEGRGRWRKNHQPPKEAISARRDFGDPASPTDAWKRGIAIHNKIRLDRMDTYMDVIKQFRHQVTNRVLAIADKVGADVNGVLAFEECAAKCDSTYDMVNKTDTEMLASFDEPNGRWSSCFQGCNIGLRNNTDGMATDQCKDLCEGRSSETYFCKLSCGSYTTFLAARTPSKRKMAREAAKKLRIRKSEAADAEKDWSEDAMANELQTARDELGRLQSELTTCKNAFLKDAKASSRKNRKKLKQAENPSWLPQWAAGMIYHNQLRVKTAQEYQKVRTTYKLLIRDRVQVIADHNYAPLWHVLALEKCAEWCDQQYFPDFNKTSATNDDLMSGWDHDVWSSCFSGCNMGFRVNPNGTKQEACEAACIGDEDAELVGGAQPGMEKQAKDPYFCQKVGCVKYTTSVDTLKPRREGREKVDILRDAKKRLRTRREDSSKWDYGFGDEWDQEDDEAAEDNWNSMASFDDELRITQDELDRLQGELAACQTGLAIPGK